MPKRILFKGIEDGPLRIFHEPEPDRIYTIGIDASTGLSTDYSVMQVITNTLPFIQVARFRAKWSVLDVGRFANLLGRYYNSGLIVCEVNHPGNAVQDALIQNHLYPRNYQAEEHLDEDPGVSCKYGFQTTQPSKWLLIREGQQVIKNDELVINCPVTVEEFGNFVYIEDKTKTGAAAGFCDDCVMAMLLAIHGALLYPQSLARKQAEVLTSHQAQIKGLWARQMKRLIGRAEGKINKNNIL